jgi:hypothetical protein
MARFEAIALSFRPSEVRLGDVVAQIGDARYFIVRMTDTLGTPREIHLELTEKWGGSWRWELQCPGCLGPARVLHVNRDAALCRRCSPRLSPHQRHKRAGAWAAEGAIADRLIRTLLQGTSSTPRVRKLAQQLKLNSLRRAAHVIERAESMVRAADALRTVAP